jgi:ketol-acid reductoisomerase
MKLFTDDIPDEIRDRKILIIGYGLLGQPVALCLRDFGHTVKVGLREKSKNSEKAKSDGFSILSMGDGSEWADAVFLLIPDDVQAKVYEKHIKGRMKEDSILVLAHGYSLLYKKLTPDEKIDVVVIAPHGPGSALRDLFLEGKGLAAQVAVFQDYTCDAETRALLLAKAMGHDRGGIKLTSVRNEVIMDHFAEQMVLCGGVVELMRAAYKTLVDSGYDPDSAYESVVRELKYTVDIIHDVGPDGLYDKISKSALIGSILHGKDALGGDVEKRMKKILKQIEAGKFMDEFEAISKEKSQGEIDRFKRELQNLFKTGK